MKARDVTFICDWTLPILIQAALSLFGVGLHFWTVIRAFRLGAGVILSAATFVLPVIAEITVVALSYRADGLGSPYCVALLAYGWLLLANWLGFVLLSDSADSEA
jgi:hypothetical protein